MVTLSFHPLGLVTKHKKDAAGAIVSTKKRSILDAKKSRANELAHSSHRLLLPRPHHAVDSTLQVQRALRARLRLLRNARKPHNKQSAEMLVADYVDAYWAIPLHHDERRFQVFQWRGRWAVLLRTGQGTKESSLTWGLISALCGRMGQSMFASFELLLQIYTDDPWFMVSGSDEERDVRMCCLLSL